MSKRLSKRMDFLYYFDKSLIVLSVRTGSISIASFATVIGAPVEMVSASFSLAFFYFYRKTVKLLKELRLYDNYCWRKKYQELKESIRMMNIQRSDVEKNNLSEEGIGINESIKNNKIINKILKL